MYPVQTPEPEVFHVMVIKIRKLRLRELRNLLKVTELQWHLSGWDLKLVLSQFAVCALDKGGTLCLCFHYIWEMVASVLSESKCLSRSLRGWSVAASKNWVSFLRLVLDIYLTLSHILRHISCKCFQSEVDCPCSMFLSKVIMPVWCEGVIFAFAFLLHKNKETAEVSLRNCCITCPGPRPHKGCKLAWPWLLFPGRFESLRVPMCVCAYTLGEQR